MAQNKEEMSKLIRNIRKGKDHPKIFWDEFLKDLRELPPRHDIIVVPLIATWVLETILGLNSIHLSTSNLYILDENNAIQFPLFVGNCITTGWYDLFQSGRIVWQWQHFSSWNNHDAVKYNTLLKNAVSKGLWHKEKIHVKTY